MKKFLLILAIIPCLVVFTADAQMSNAVTRSLTVTKTPLTLSADTSYCPVVIDNTVLGFEVHGLKTSGSVSGKAYIYGIGPLGTTLYLLDSLAIANSSGDQFKLYTVPARTPYLSYKVSFISAGGTWVPSVVNIRRPQ